MRAHWSDGHLYSGDRVRKLQALSVIAWSTSWILMRLLSLEILRHGLEL